MVIGGVIHNHKGIDHKDARREIFTIFNKDFGGFKVEHVKLYNVLQNCELAGHFHDYSEIFYILHGGATFTLIDIETKEKEKYILKEHDVLFLPKKVAHKVSVEKGSIFLGCMEKPYISPEVNNREYEF